MGDINLTEDESPKEGHLWKDISNTCSCERQLLKKRTGNYNKNRLGRNMIVTGKNKALEESYREVFTQL